MFKVAVVFACCGLTACSSLDSVVSSAKHAAIESGEYIGLIDQSTMKVPDYYATKQLPRQYEFGRHYDLDELGCDAENNKCD